MGLNKYGMVDINESDKLRIQNCIQALSTSYSTTTVNRSPEYFQVIDLNEE
jgi:hypothetical protein